MTRVCWNERGKLSLILWCLYEAACGNAKTPLEKSLSLLIHRQHQIQSKHQFRSWRKSYCESMVSIWLNVCI
jgi:hypothetical protein